MPTRLPSIAEPSTNCAKANPVATVVRSLTTTGPVDRRLPDRACEHRRTASGPNEEERLRRRGMPARQVVIDLELARRTGRGATDNACISRGGRRSARTGRPRTPARPVPPLSTVPRSVVPLAPAALDKPATVNSNNAMLELDRIRCRDMMFPPSLAFDPGELP